MKVLPCVDVVVPVFNGRDTITTALISVLAQEHDWVHRIIVIDDGSSDDTTQVVQNLGSPLIELVRTSNQGVARARNLGFEKATAEWVAFLDADDVWMPGKLQAQIAAAQEHGASFVCGSVSIQSTIPSTLISAKMLAGGNFVATSSVLVKRSVLKQIEPVFVPGMSFAEDYLAWLKCVTLAPGYYLSAKVVDYTLSEHPRYSLGLILRSLLLLNVEYARFLKQLGVSRLKIMDLMWAIFLGSLRSCLSITKRLFKSYCTRSKKVNSSLEH